MDWCVAQETRFLLSGLASPLEINQNLRFAFWSFERSNAFYELRRLDSALTAFYVAHVACQHPVQRPSLLMQLLRCDQQLRIPNAYVKVSKPLVFVCKCLPKKNVNACRCSNTVPHT